MNAVTDPLRHGSHPIKLSVCIPTYNRSVYLANAITSVLAQVRSYAVEIVVCDNCSTDDTRNVVAQFTRDYPNIPFHYVQREVNVGADRNVIEIADFSHGEYFWIFGSDDSMPPGAMDAVMTAISETDADLILGDANNCDANLQQTGYLKFLHGLARELRFGTYDDVMAFLDATTMTASLFGFISAMVFKRKTWDSIPLSRYTIGSAYPQVYHSLDIVFRAAGRVRYLAVPIANDRRDNCGYTVEFGIASRYMIDLRMFRNVIDEYFSGDLRVRNRFKQFVRSCFGRAAQEKTRTGIAVLDNLLMFFEDDDTALPEVKYWERDPLVERAFQRFEANGFNHRYLNGNILLHLGYRRQGSAKLRPINDRAIGVDQGYSGYDGTRLPFESSHYDALYANDYFPAAENSTAAIREWFRVLQVGGHVILSNALRDSGNVSSGIRVSSIFSAFENALPIDSYQILECVETRGVTGADQYAEVDIVIRKVAPFSDQAAIVPAPAISTNVSSVPELLNQAIRLHGGGNLGPAADFARQVLGIDGKNIVALQLLGVIAYQQGDHIEAICKLTDALAINRLLSEAFSNLGCAYAALGGNAEAIQCFAAALSLRPDFLDAERNLGVLQGNVAQHEQVRASFLQLLTTHPPLQKALITLKGLLGP